MSKSQLAQSCLSCLQPSLALMRTRDNEAIWKNSKTVPFRKGSHEFEDPDEGIICFPQIKGLVKHPFYGETHSNGPSLVIILRNGAIFRCFRCLNLLLQLERKEFVSLFYLRLDLKPRKPLLSSNTIYPMLL